MSGKFLLGAMTFAIGVAVAQAGDDAAKEQAIARGRSALASQLSKAPDGLEVTGAERQTWNNSALGCGRPGEVSLQVITEGYAITFKAEARTYRVHVAGEHVVVCDSLVREKPTAARARGLDTMLYAAREDLAKRLHVQIEDIKIRGFKPQRWADSTLGCTQPEADSNEGPVAGFRLMLLHAGRIFTYHTDLKEVMPCPPIETE
jgi:hypothetical protein